MTRILDAHKNRIVEVKETVDVESYIDFDELTIVNTTDLSEIVGKAYTELTNEQKELLGNTHVWESGREIGEHEVIIDFDKVGLAVVATLVVNEEDEELKFDNTHKIYYPSTDYIEL